MPRSKAEARFALLLCALGSAAGAQPPADPLALVDVFIGSAHDGKDGNIVPGASVPFGFVNLSPDTTNGSTNGYDPHSLVTGLSFAHESGTGGNSKYGNFRVLPTVGPFDPRNAALPRRMEAGSPGYYQTVLEDQGYGIGVEASATRLGGILHVTFPPGPDGNLSLDATSSVQLMGNGPKATEAHVQWIDAQSFEGWGVFAGGWNPVPIKLYFAARINRPAKAWGSFEADSRALKLHPGTEVATGGDQRADATRILGAYATFDTTHGSSASIKLAVSFIGVKQARRNLDREIPGWDLETVHGAAREQWRDALNRIRIEGGSDAERRNFMTALYRSHTMPHDLTGENVWWASDAPHYEDYYTLWDTFRTLHPLLTLIEPDRQRAMLNSLLETYRHTGWLPDARIAGGNGLTQGGSNGDVLVADAVVKKLGGFDRKLALEAIRKDGEVESPDPLNVGRALSGYLALGYMPLDQTRSASRTLEYAYDDFAIAEVAQAEGETALARTFLKRSGNWRNLWDARLGCIRPRYADGGWMAHFDCAHLYPDNRTAWWDAPFYEGSSAQYSTYVPHDVGGLIESVGGDAAFNAWLDRLFDGGGYNHSNEPDFLAPYLYIHAGRPDRTAERVRAILAKDYRPTADGLPGNDDAGAMSSWYVWSAIGLFPNAGQPFYYIASPLFTRTTIRLEGGRSFTINAPAASAANLYVIAARLNGKPIDRAWLTHDEIVKGGVLDLDMAAHPGSWATHFVAPPNPFRPG